MATRWEGGDMMVRMSGVLKFCCQAPATTLQVPPLPPNHWGLPNPAHDPTVTWTNLLQNHRMPVQETPRFTILPTISVVSPWDDPIDAALDAPKHNFLTDQEFGDSNAVVHVLAPTPVLPPPVATTAQPRWVEEAAVNATQRFYDVLRAVIHGGGASGGHHTFRDQPALNAKSVLGSQPSLGEDVVARVEGSEVHESVAGVAPHVSSLPSGHSSPIMSPLLQVCIVLGVLVLVMVVLFHSHHFRRDCMTDRRAVRRVARRYHVTRSQDDVERNDEVTDVTL